MDYASSLLNLLPTGRRSIGVTQLLNKLETYLPPAQVDRIRDAYEFGAEAHEGQKRLSGEPYIAHPVAVAHILADLHLDAPTIVAAILHDVIEDTSTAKDEIAERFGADVAELVDGVSKLDHIQFRSRAEAQAESFRKMLLAMVRDIRVIMVKLADRTHNMRTLGSVPPAKRRTVARETLEIYAPIANRLGIHAIKSELEELGFKALYPGRYRIIEKALKRARGNQKQFVGKIADNLRGALDKAGVQSRVEGREKHLYSIYQKMRRKSSPLSSIVDMFGFRIVVDSVDTCYRALGVVHGLYRPMPGRFKDYIAIPRINGYQSLHTTLFGPNGMPIEVQIRTEEMHRVAEAGIAAHWQYKSGEEVGHVVSRSRERVAPAPDGDAARRQLRGVHGERQGRPVSRQGVRVHAARRDSASAAQRHRGRLRLLRAHRHRQPLRRRQSGSPARAAAHAAAQRPDRGNHHREGRDAQSRLGELRSDREGPCGHSPLPQGVEAFRRSGARQAAPHPGARGPVARAQEDSRRPTAVGGRRTEPEEPRRAVRADRPRRTTGAARRAPSDCPPKDRRPPSPSRMQDRSRSPAPKAWS